MVRKRKPRLWLILGGARSGKSRYAQRLAEHLWRRPLYLAAAEVSDAEMSERIRKHREARGCRWLCAEEPLETACVIADPGTAADGILFDCATVWLSNVLLKEGESSAALRQEDLLTALRKRRRDVIVVANEVGMGIVPAYALGRTFRDLAGWLNQALAEEADTVVFVTAGLPAALKGRLPGLSRRRDARS